jgi:hypothetical protein
MDLDVLAAAAQLDQHLVAAVGQRDDAFALAQQRQARPLRVAQSQNLHLRAHQRAGTGSFEAAAFARQLGHVGCGRHHRGLFDRHGHQHVAAIDLEIAGYAQRQLERTDDVLDHAVGAVQTKRARLGKQRALRGRERGGVGDGCQALRGGQGAEVGQA